MSRSHVAVLTLRFALALIVVFGLIPGSVGRITSVTAQDNAVAADQFARTVADGWGSAETGGAYTLLGPSSDFSVNGTTGRMNVPSIGMSRGALLKSVSAQDVDLTVRVQTDKVAAGSSLYTFLVARYVSFGNEYFGTLELEPGGAVHLRTARVVAGSESLLGTETTVAGLTHYANTALQVRLQVTGTNPTTLRMKAWTAGLTEPSSWQFSATDSATALQTAGGVGLRSRISSDGADPPVTFAFDDFRATSPSTSAPTPTATTAPTSTAIATAAPTNTSTPTATPADTPTATATSTSTSIPTAAATSTATATTVPTNTSIPTAAPTNTSTATATAANTPTPTATAANTPTPTAAATNTPTGDTVAALDQFTRTVSSGWGSAGTGGVYTLVGTSSNFAVNGTTGRMVVPSAGVSRSALLASVSARDVDLTARFQTDKLAAGSSQYAFFVARRVSAGNEYFGRVELEPGGAIRLRAARVVAGTEALLGTEATATGLTHQANSALQVRLQVTGTNPTTLRMKVWAAGQTEPSSWQYSATDSATALQTAGGVGLRSRMSSGGTNAPVAFAFDDFRAGSPSSTAPAPTATAAATSTPTRTATAANTSTPTPAATNTPTPTATAANTPTPTAAATNTPTGDTAVALDQFTRTVSSGWGSAGTGGAYTLLGTSSNFSVNGTTGRMAIPSAGVSRSALLASVSARDVDLTARFQTDKLAAGSSQYAFFVARRVSAGNEYFGRVELEPGGAIRLRAARVVAGTEALLGTEATATGLTHQANTALQVRLQVTGINPTTLRMKVWATGQSEPSSWQFSATDSATALQTAGGVGLRSRMSSGGTNAPVAFLFDDFRVGSPSTTAPTPTATTAVTSTSTATTAATNTSTPTAAATSTATRTPTPTNTPTRTPAPTSTPTRTATPTSTPSNTSSVVLDQFTRTVSSGWGSASTGGAYTLSGTSMDFSVNGTMGRMRVPTAGTDRQALLASVSARDVDVTVRVQTDKVAAGSSLFVVVVGRYVSAGNEYFGTARLEPTGAIRVKGSRLIAGSETALGTETTVAGATHQANSALLVRLQVTGTNPTTLRMKVWGAGQTEPTSWQFSATDSATALQTAGSVGLRARVGNNSTNAPVTFSFDDFQARTPLTSTNTPTATAGATNTPTATATATRTPTATATATRTPTATAASIATPTATAASIATPTPTAEPATLLPPAGEGIKDTNYPIPSGAYFVSPSGNDSNPGTQSAPWRTLAKAVSATTSGKTIVMRGGIYRESVRYYGKALTIQPYPHEKVWLKGSIVVTDWVEDGSIWRKDNWIYEFTQGGLRSEFIDPAYPYAAYPDMVFINGQPLRQVGSISSVTTGTFYVDYATDKLYIGSDPSGKTVEGSTRAQALYIDKGDGSVLRGLGFMHYATHRNQFGTVRASANRLTIENNTFAWNAAAGLAIFGTDAAVRGNTFVRNGQLGLFGSRAHGLLFEQNRVAYNNQERFKNWESGGIKITTGENMVWQDNVVEYNFETGMWVDVESYNVKIVRNLVRNNSRHGIMYEISAGGLIASNVVVRNASNGIFVLESNDVDIYNNTIVKNRQNVRIAEGSRTSTSTLITKNVQDVVMKNNIYSNSSDSSQAFLVVNNSQLTFQQMGVVLNYNAYYRTSSTAPGTLAYLAGGTSGHKHYKSVSALQSSVGQEQQGLGIDNTSTNPFFVDEANGDYRLKDGSVAINRGQALPTSIASAIGVDDGVSVNLGALRWPGNQ